MEGTSTKASKGMNPTLKKVIGLIISVAVGAFIATRTPPEGLSVEGIRFIGIFVAAILAMIFRTMPDFMALICVLLACVIFDVADFSTSFSAFSGSTVWTVIFIFGFAAVMIKTGIVKRVAFILMKPFPKTYNGQILALMVVSMIVTMFIPLALAKVSIFAAIAAVLAKANNFKPGSKGVAGMFLAICLPSQVYNAAFLTGSPMTFLMIGMMDESYQAQYSGWFGWLSHTWLWLVISLVVTYFIIIKFFKPEDSGNGQQFTLADNFYDQKLTEMGKMNRNEILSAVVLVVTFVFLFLSNTLNIDTSIIAGVAFAVLVITGLLTPQDIQSKMSWTMILMIGAIFSVSNLLDTTGVQDWIGEVLYPILEPVVQNAYILVLLICIVTYLLRYVVVSITAMVPICYAIFGGVAAAMGVQPFVVLFVSFVSAQVWNLSFNNVQIIQGQALMENMPTYKSIQPMSYIYMIVNTVACLASVPLWTAMGVIA